MSDPGHHVGRRSVALQELSHHAHQRAGVGKEEFEPRAEIVLARLAILRQRKAILWAAAIAQEPHLAFAALLSQRIALVGAELAHLRRGNELNHRRCRDVAELLSRLDEMVAGV